MWKVKSVVLGNNNDDDGNFSTKNCISQNGDSGELATHVYAEKREKEKRLSFNNVSLMKELSFLHCVFKHLGNIKFSHL